MEPSDKLYCVKCKAVLKSSEFYTSNNYVKYPSGKMDQCKKCRTMHVDNWNPETFLPILEDADVPWIPHEWNKILERFADRDPKEITGTTIIGRYITQMKLNQWKKYRWRDTEAVQAKDKEEREESLRSVGYDEDYIKEITKESNKQIWVPRPQGDLMTAEKSTIEIEKQRQVIEEQEEEEKMFDESLTKEDRKMLSLKWGHYTAKEWVQLEQLYQDMLNSYDIQTAGHFDNLKLVCKASLKAHQLLDANDIEGAQKATKMYDALMKSGKFTAQQNKEDKDNFVDSIGQFVEMCEKEGYIEEYYIERPQDKVDQVLQDYKDYVSRLVREEENLGSLIESSLKILAEQEEQEKKGDVDIDEDNLADLESSIHASFEEEMEEDAALDEAFDKYFKEGAANGSE